MIERSEQYDLLQGLGCSARLAEAVDRLYQDNFVSELSDQVIDNLKGLPEGVALQAVQKFRVSDLSTVINRSAFFLGIIRSFKSHAAGQGAAVVSSVGDGAGGQGSPDYVQGQVTILKRPPPSKNAPDAAKLKELLARTGYSHEVTPSLRRYGGPPPEWSGDKPAPGTEVFLGRIPADIFEDDLIPLFEAVGKIYELRVITDHEGYNRGYGFVTFCDKESARDAVKQLNRHEIKPHRRIVVKLSVQFTRLYVGGIPKSKTKEDVFSAFSKEVDKLKNVIMQDSDSQQSDVKNKGFCFLEFETYFDAAAARKKLLNGRQRISAWDNYSRFVVDWAIPLENPDEEVAANSTVILVNNLNDSITNDDLVARFQKYGTIKKVNKKAHYAFITFHERPAALAAEQSENKATLKDCQMDVQMHVPLSGIAKRMVQTIKGPSGAANGGPPRSAGVQMMRSGGGPGGNRGRGRGGFVGGQGGQYPRSAGVPRRAGQFTKSRILQRNAGTNGAMYGPTGGYVDPNGAMYEGQQGGGSYGGMGPSGYGAQGFHRF